ncbi:MAG: DUF3786 domain-containing protein [Deltaproteobacteria bacterium]|jgi:hypothetical protein|nr:DUF3786 domain-containing protein [Deltaproteobacteria bacterium]
MTKAKTNKARIAYNEIQMRNLAELDLPSQAKAMGLEWDEKAKAVRVKFLGREYLVANDGITATDGKFPTVDAKSVLAHYLASKGTGDPSPDFLPLKRLTGIASGTSGPSENLSKPLGDKFGPNYEAFGKAALEIGARHEGRSPAGAQAFLLEDLPKLPVRLEFFEADDEFEAESKVLFNSASTRFVSYECLELITMCVVVEMLLKAGLISDPEECEASFI